MSLLALGLVAALGVAVTYGTPRDNGASNGNDITLGYVPDGANPAESLGAQGPVSILGTWTDGDYTYLFDGSRCTINYEYDTATPYSARTATVKLHSGATRATTIYVLSDGVGTTAFGFIDGKLYYIPNMNGRWEVWYEVSKIKDPVEGTWLDYYNTFTEKFDNGVLTVTTKVSSGFNPFVRDKEVTYTYHYTLSSAIVGDHGRLPVYVTDMEYRDAYCFIDGTLWSCTPYTGHSRGDYSPLTYYHRAG